MEKKPVDHKPAAYLYETVFVNYKPFYKFKVGRKVIGYVEAGAAVVVRGTHYDTAFVLSALGHITKTHNRFPSQVFEDMPSTPEAHSKRDFVKLCTRLSKLAKAT